MPALAAAAWANFFLGRLGVTSVTSTKPGGDTNYCVTFNIAGSRKCNQLRQRITRALNTEALVLASLAAKVSATLEEHDERAAAPADHSAAAPIEHPSASPASIGAAGVRG